MLDAAVTNGRLAAALADRYRIIRELGAGGMATVYLAEDLKHDRKIALKVLKPELAAVLGADRFVVEIKTTAALQHPHILPLFDSGTADGFLYYVMPFIDGETLRTMLDRETQLGVGEAVKIACQVADALDYAHRHGVVHRDIKPENILLHDGRPMVADFGIALAVSAAAGGRMTETGLSLGTPHYMSPEQATADREISARSDIYSLGSVLYEMLAGNPPHTGSSAQQIIMKVITEQPPAVTQHRKSVPPNVAAAVTKALEKLPADRFDSAARFAEALGNPAFVHHGGTAGSTGAHGVRQPWNRVTVGLAAISVVLAMLLGATSWSRRGEANGTDRMNPVVRFSLGDDPSLRIDAGTTRPFAVSPDGRTIVFRASTDSTPPQLWIRTIDDPRARPLEGTTDGANAALSPDGSWVAFVVGNVSLRKVRITGGDASVIAQLDGVAAALSWASDDEIVFEQISPDGGIHRINASGGRPQLLVPIDTAAGEARQRRPLVLRNARVVVYASYTDAGDEPTLVLHRMSDGRRVRLGIAESGPLAMIDDDHLVYSRRDGTLMAVAIDAREMKATGAPVPVTPRVASVRTGNSVGVSESGTLVYRTADASAAAHLDLIDTSGTARRISGEFAVTGAPRFSPDGRRIVVEVGAGGALGPRMAGFLTSDLWTIDLTTGEPTRVTAGNVAAAPSWSPDGKRLVYLAARDSAFELWSAAVDGSVSPSRLASAKGFFAAASIVPDGRSVIVQAQASRAIARGAGLLRIWIDGSERVDTVIAPSRAGLRPETPRVSPDGRWVSFVDRTTSDVWVRSLSGPTMMQVTTSGTGGNSVVWGADSRQLFYTHATMRGGAGDRFRDGIVAIDLQTEPALAVIRRRAVRGLPPNEGYDLSPNGATYAVVSPVRATTGIVVVVNWADDARRQWRAAARP